MNGGMKFYEQRTRYILGLDLGPPGEHTALATIEAEHRLGKDAHYHVRHLRRWPPGTSYPRIVADGVQMTNEPPLRGTLLAVDQTGVGRPVAEILEQAGPYELTRVIVSSGHAAGWAEDGARLVPKRDLVGILQVLLQSRRLRIAGQLPEAAILEQELLCFRAKTPTAGVEDAEAWRERPHDDLVLAVALACWLGNWRRRR